MLLIIFQSKNLIYISGTKQCYEEPVDLMDSIRKALNPDSTTEVKTTKPSTPNDPSDKTQDLSDDEDKIERQKMP